jgi:hypothetical protein
VCDPASSPILLDARDADQHPEILISMVRWNIEKNIFPFLNPWFSSSKRDFPPSDIW